MVLIVLNSDVDGRYTSHAGDVENVKRRYAGSTINYLKIEWFCPGNGTAVLKGL